MKPSVMRWMATGRSRLVLNATSDVSCQARALSSSAIRLSQSKEENRATSKQELFFDSKVQDLLKRLTGLDAAKVFRVAKLGQKISAPTYAFLTEKELKETQRKARQEALKKLQMPPVMDVRSEDTDVLEVDEAIQGYDSAKLVFTDITFGIHDRDRLIVTRDPDGTLRQASPAQRDRLNQIYFPKEGRKVNCPPMFEPENLEEILVPNRYLYVLDRNCAQFEPDHPVYIRTAQIVFEHVNANGHFEALWSTRHFGPLVFHLVWEKKVDDLLTHYLHKRNLKSVNDLLRLYVQFYPACKFSKIESGLHQPYNRDSTIESLRQFINLESHKPTKLRGALEVMLEVEESNKQATLGTDQAHGS